MKINFENVSIRRMMNVDADYELILKWYKNPVVTEYFKPVIETKEGAIKKYLPRINRESNVVPCIIEMDNGPIGYVQYYSVENAEKKKYNLPINKIIYGIDIFIGKKISNAKELELRL